MKAQNINHTSILKRLALCLSIMVFILACSSDSDSTETEEVMEEGVPENEEITENPQGSLSCTTPADFIFEEENGLLLIEMENSSFSGDWALKTNEPNYSGEGFLVWEGNQSLGNPGNGLIEFELKISNAGTYRFLWFSAVTIGDNGTEHNDTWLKFSDANDFFGKRNESVVYPRDTGRTPNPEGSSSDGWFKIYRSGNDLGFKWQARTSDNDAHDIFVTFDAPGNYTMQVSARSSGHAIDKFVLFSEAYTTGEATEDTNSFSTISCN